MWAYVFIALILLFIFTTILTTIESAKPKVYLANGSFGTATFETRSFSNKVVYSFYFTKHISSCSLFYENQELHLDVGNTQILHGEIKDTMLVKALKDKSLKLVVDSQVYDTLGIGKNRRLAL